MRAHRADFSEPGEVKALSCHGHQTSGIVNPEIGTEFYRSGEKGTWLCQLG